MRSNKTVWRWCPILAKQGWGTDKRRDDIDTRDLALAGRWYRSVPHPSARAKDGAPALVTALCTLTMLGILQATGQPSFSSDGGGETVGSASRTSLGGWAMSSGGGDTIRTDIVGRNTIESPTSKEMGHPGIESSTSNEMGHPAENHGRKDAAMPPAVTVKDGPHGGLYAARDNDIADDVTSQHSAPAGQRRGPALSLACATISMGGGVTDNGSIGIIGQPLAGTMSSAEFTIEVGIVPCLTAPVGCGACQTYGEVFPFDPGNPNQDPSGDNVGNCVVDIDDLLVILGAFAASDPVNHTHCASQGGPFPDAVNIFPPGQACVDGVVDIDDVVAELGAFAGNFAGPHRCSPGACTGTLTDNNGNPATCLDWDQQPPEQTPPGGMSLTTCFNAGGTYQGDGTTCADVTCP